MLLTDQLAPEPRCWCGDPEKVRTARADLDQDGPGVPGSVVVGGGRRRCGPVDIEQLGGLGFGSSTTCVAAARPVSTVVDAEPAFRRDESAVARMGAAGGAVGTSGVSTEPGRDLRDAARALRDGRAGRRGHPGAGTAARVVEQLAESDTAAMVLEPGAEPKPGVVGVLKARCTTGWWSRAPTWW